MTVVRKQKDAPALVNYLITQALQINASDIHLEPRNHLLTIRFRIDGMLNVHDSISYPLAEQIIACLKVRAHIDITEKRIPQDGTFNSMYEDQAVDFRVSSFPSLHGETLVIRILNRPSQAVPLDTLGFHTDLLIQFQQLINQSQGFILVAGPTGSGKTTTLYAALSTRNTSDVNIITLEDPVEYYLDGVTQGHVRPSTGFTFEKGVRALLRQDPDIVMIGEIRDIETARIAIQASLTGHLVFSTVHANNASNVIVRLMDMGIEPFLLNASLSGVLAQRLVRKICIYCRIEVSPTGKELALCDQFGKTFEALYRGMGCSECRHTGYKGRIGIFEFIVVTDALRSLISSAPLSQDIRDQASADGMQSLLDDGLHKVGYGVTTLEELVRVIN